MPGTIRKIILFFLYGVLIGIAMYSYNAQSKELILNIHIGSYHDGTYWSSETKKETEFNGTNPGAGLALGLNKNFDIRAGAYRNSFDTNSVYLGSACHTSKHRIIGAGLIYGVVTGYDGHVYRAEVEYKPVQPFIMPALFINQKRVRHEIGYMPPVVAAASAITYSAGVRF